MHLPRTLEPLTAPANRSRLRGSSPRGGVGIALLRCAALTVAACGAQAANEHTESAPHYEGTCTLAGIDEVPAPAEQTDDSVTMVARYSFDAAPDTPPWSLRFQVARARAHDLQAHLQAHSTVLCNPDHVASGGDAARVQVPPFEHGPNQ